MSQKTIAIFTSIVTGMRPWDLDSVKKGVGGSEEAVIYMAKHLAQLNYKVYVIGYPPSDSPYLSSSSNPRFIDMREKNFFEKPFDIGIVWRRSEMGLEVKRLAKKIYLWPHDAVDLTFTKEQIDAYDDVFWQSKWQKDYFLQKNPGFSKYSKILGNGIDPELFSPVAEKENPYSCIYGSSYDRGLEILLDAWPEIIGEFPRATLDIYYGTSYLKVGRPDLERKLRRKMSSLKGVVDRGQVGHEELNCAYAKASLWPYPCIIPEVFCITALRAQFSGVVPVVLQHYALRETVRYGYRCEDLKDFLPMFREALKNAPEISLESRKQMQAFINEEFTWKTIAQKWDRIFQRQG